VVLVKGEKEEVVSNTSPRIATSLGGVVPEGMLASSNVRLP
jgi:hypothetical protein